MSITEGSCVEWTQPETHEQCYWLSDVQHHRRTTRGFDVRFTVVQLKPRDALWYLHEQPVLPPPYHHGYGRREHVAEDEP